MFYCLFFFSSWLFCLFEIGTLACNQCKVGFGMCFVLCLGCTYFLFFRLSPTAYSSHLLFQTLLYKKCSLQYKTMFCMAICTICWTQPYRVKFDWKMSIWGLVQIWWSYKMSMLCIFCIVHSLWAFFWIVHYYFSILSDLHR